MSFIVDIIPLIASYIYEPQELSKLKTISTQFYEASKDELYWKSSTVECNLKNRKLIVSLVNNFFDFFEELETHKELYFTLKNSLKSWIPLQLCGSNLFSHIKILSLVSSEKFKENIQLLQTITYPLNHIRFVSQEERLKKFLAPENYFTLLHYAVWTENVELCDYLVKYNFLDTKDLLQLHPFTYACHLRNEKIINILLENFKEKTISTKEINSIVCNIGDDKNLNYLIEKLEIIGLPNNDNLEELDGDPKRNGADKDYFYYWNKPRQPTIYNFKNNKPNWIDEPELLSDDDPNEEGIPLKELLDSNHDELLEKTQKFEIIHDVGEGYNLERFVETIHRKPRSQTNDFNDEFEEQPKKKQKIEAYTKKDFVIPKYEFDLIIRETIQKFSIFKNFSPLARFIVQDAMENVAVASFQKIQHMMKLGISFNHAITLWKRMVDYRMCSHEFPIQDYNLEDLSDHESEYQESEASSTDSDEYGSDPNSSSNEDDWDEESENKYNQLMKMKDDYEAKMENEIIYFSDEEGFCEYIGEHEYDSD
jgi:hypothetical protein